MNPETLILERHDAVLRVVLNRPERLNALSDQLLRELHETLAAAADDDAVRCVLLTGQGRGFSAGADLRDAASAARPGEPIDFGARLEQTYHPVLRAIRGMPKPVVAAVNGVAAGAGCNIALACDVVVAARSARFIQAFVRIGLVPDAGGTWTIPRLIGRARAMRWMMTGDELDAETAERWGLVTEVFDDAELADRALALATRLAQGPTLALAAIKRLIDASGTADFESQIALEARTQTDVGRSTDTIEGISAFLEKRPPKFTGR